MSTLSQGLTYKQAHARVWKEKGRAGHYICIGCGEEARFWAYQHTDEDALTDPLGRPYSGDPKHYEPMCASCHRVFDLKNDARVKESARAGGQWRGRENSRRLREDEEYRLRMQKVNQATVKKVQKMKRRCNECGMVSTPYGIGSHQRKGHSGYTELKD